MITVAALSGLAPVRHAFFTRLGGVSDGIYASLNCGLGSSDDTAAVTRNRARAMAMLDLPPEALVTAYQVHSAQVQVVEETWAPAQSPRLDALVTRRPGVALGILAADCAPVLLADAQAGVIGAAHAGWRGAFDGVLDATVEAMIGLGAAPGRIVAAVGPCIAQASYEVGPEFQARFVEREPMDARWFVPSARPTHFMFDLPGYVRHRLERLALGSITVVDADTCADPERFFSYRRSCLVGEPGYGRALAAIALAG